MISIIIPTLNRNECLFNTLASFSHTSAETPFEILVIDQTTNPPQCKIDRIIDISKGLNLQYFNINIANRSLAKNIGIEKSSGELILFCDDDIVVDANFLKTHSRIHTEHPDVGAMSCHLIESDQEEIIYDRPLRITCYGRFINKANSISSGYVTSLNGGNMSFKRSALNKVGFFDERLSGTSMLEEPDIAYRLLKSGYRLFFSSASKVLHYPQHNGNIALKNKNLYNWTKDYFFNQYLFAFKNHRIQFIPLIYVYVTFRSFITLYKSRATSLKVILTPSTMLIDAYRFWKGQNNNSKSKWFTPRFNHASILKHIRH